MSQITEKLTQYFDANPNEQVYCGEFPGDGNSKVLAFATTFGKNKGRAIYAFSVDREGGKVAHVNYVPKEILAQKKIDGKKWLAEVSKVVGGKVS